MTAWVFSRTRWTMSKSRVLLRQLAAYSRVPSAKGSPSLVPKMKRSTKRVAAKRGRG